MTSKYGTKVNRVAAGRSAIRRRKQPGLSRTGKSSEIPNYCETYDLGTIEARSNGRSGNRTTAEFSPWRRSNNMRRSK